MFVGTPGSVGDAHNFQRSRLSKNLLTQPEMLLESEHIQYMYTVYDILGDGAYTLTSKVMIPFIDDGHLTPQQRTHNFLLSRARASVEISFALMRAKHRRAKLLPMRNPEYLMDHILAGFMLHNFIILEGLEMEGLPPFPDNPVPNYEALLEEAKVEGTVKREYIARMLCAE